MTTIQPQWFQGHCTSSGLLKMVSCVRILFETSKCVGTLSASCLCSCCPALVRRSFPEFLRDSPSPKSKRLGVLCDDFETDVVRWLLLMVGLRGGAKSHMVAGSIPDGVIGIFHWHNPSGRTMTLGSTQPLTEMIIRDIFWGVKAAGA
jgi:hypothetical protein